MEDVLKGRVILILTVLSIILTIGLISSCNNAYRQSTAREREIASRIDLEEKMNKVLQERNMLDDKVKRLENDLGDHGLKLEETEKSLEQEQSVNASLKSELEKLDKLKEVLEEDLKEALTKK